MSNDFRSIRPKADEHLPYYSLYIDRVPDGDIIDMLEKQTPEMLSFLRAIPESRVDFRYAPGKWSIRQMIGHLGDGERVFQYRAFRFSRADATPVPGFDENHYVDNAPFEHIATKDLIDELENLRGATLQMFKGMDADAMSRRGTANGAEVSVRAIAWIICGHVSHHMQILRERYLER